MRRFQIIIELLGIHVIRAIQLISIVLILVSRATVAKADLCEAINPMIQIGNTQGTNERGIFCSLDIKEIGIDEPNIRADITIGDALISNLILSCHLNEFDEVFFIAETDQGKAIEIFFQELNGVPLRFLNYETNAAIRGSHEIFDCHF